MAIIDVEINMYYEMMNTMKNNYQGTPLQRYKQAKKSFLDSVSDIIEQNKADLLKEVEEDVN